MNVRTTQSNTQVAIHDLHTKFVVLSRLRDNQALTYPHEGRPGSLTDMAITKAKVVNELLN